jgi:hypothetical protein
MKALILALVCLSSFSAFAQEARPIKIHQCVLEISGVIEKASTLYSSEWNAISSDLIETNKTKIATVAQMKNKCLSLSQDNYFTLRFVGTKDEVISYYDKAAVLAHNLIICQKLIKENMTCEVGEAQE